MEYLRDSHVFAPAAGKVRREEKEEGEEGEKKFLRSFWGVRA